jgi:hypothetical protein
VGAGGTGGVAGQSGNGGIGGIGGTGGTAGAGAKGGTTGEGGEAGSSCSPAVERCNGLDDDCNDAVDEGSVCPSGCSAKTREGHTYLLCLASGSTSGPVYGGARARCEAAAETLELGVDFELVRIESEPENDFLKAWIAASTSTSGAIWIGANDLEDENIWVWGDDPPSERFFTASNQGGGSPYMGRFNDFAEGRPNGVNGGTEDCGAMDSSFSWHWNDVVCSNGRLGYLCEQTP